MQGPGWIEGVTITIDMSDANGHWKCRRINLDEGT